MRQRRSKKTGIKNDFQNGVSFFPQKKRGGRGASPLCFLIGPNFREYAAHKNKQLCGLHTVLNPIARRKMPTPATAIWKEKRRRDPIRKARKGGSGRGGFRVGKNRLARIHHFLHMQWRKSWEVHAFNKNRINLGKPVEVAVSFRKRKEKEEEPDAEHKHH